MHSKGLPLSLSVLEPNVTPRAHHRLCRGHCFGGTACVDHCALYEDCHDEDAYMPAACVAMKELSHTLRTASCHTND
jgi:hypothetical protein